MNQFKRVLNQWDTHTHEEWISEIFRLIVTRVGNVDPDETLELDDGTIINRREALCNYLLNTIDHEINEWHDCM
jgi:hypothetical protein